MEHPASAQVAVDQAFLEVHEPEADLKAMSWLMKFGATKTPNFMSHDIAFKSSLGFVDFQKRLIHSYLGGGRVFQQYQQVNFDALSYLVDGEAL